MGLIYTFVAPIDDLRRRVKDIASSFLVPWEHLKSSIPPPSCSLGNTLKIISLNSVGEQSIFSMVISFSPKPANIKSCLFKGSVSSLVSDKQKNL